MDSWIDGLVGQWGKMEGTRTRTSGRRGRCVLAGVGKDGRDGNYGENGKIKITIRITIKMREGSRGEWALARVGAMG
jgi:hypothetical protein